MMSGSIGGLGRWALSELAPGGGLRRWYDTDSLENRNEAWMRAFVTKVAPALRRYFKADIRGVERIPRGAALYVGNHNGGGLMPDVYLFGSALFEHGGLDDMPYALAHDIIMRLPLLHQFFVPLGAVRACHENAQRIFSSGRKVLVYPGGDREAMRPFAQRDRIVFGERRGYVRLAIRHGVPIVPVVAHGAHGTAVILNDGRWIVERLGLDRRFRLNAWPITLSVPWGVTFGPPPPYIPLPTRITIEVLEPIELGHDGPRWAEDRDYVEACHDEVSAAMQAALDRLAARKGAAAVAATPPPPRSEPSVEGCPAPAESEPMAWGLPVVRDEAQVSASA